METGALKSARSASLRVGNLFIQRFDLPYKIAPLFFTNLHSRATMYRKYRANILTLKPNRFQSARHDGRFPFAGPFSDPLVYRLELAQVDKL